MLFSFLLLVILVSCAPRQSAKPQQRISGRNIDKIVDSMSLEEKVGQLFMPNFSAKFYNEYDSQFLRIKKWITKYHIGSLAMFGGDPYEAARNIERFQRIAKQPLLIAADFEWGVPMRLSAGTRFPENMGIGATRSVKIAYQEGVITAREAKSLGIHINFSPVMDVNNNPDNPIINVRSYGENPTLVSELGSAYIRGVQSEHMAATAKHFPGHGDTDLDSHLMLPVIDVSRARLDSIELKPFAAAVKAGVKVIMAAHLALPKITGDNEPASLSPYVIQHILRDSLDFDGVVVTDAMVMGGIRAGYWPGEAAVKAIQAGVDIIVYPSDFELAYQTVIDAVDCGRISEARIDESVRRILQLKKFVQVDDYRYPDLKKAEQVLANPGFNKWSSEAYRRSITLVKNENSILPMDAGAIDNMVTIVITDNIDYGFPGDTFVNRISAKINHNRVFRIAPNTADTIFTEAKEAVKQADAATIGVFVRFASYKGSINLPENQAVRLDSILQLNVPVITVGFGTPYLLRDFPSARCYLVPYSSSYPAQEAVVHAIFGEQKISGKLPISLPAGFSFGHGIDVQKYSHVWKDDPQPEKLQPVFDLVKQGIADSVAPGMAVYIAQNGKVLTQKGFGHFTYDPESPKVTADTHFDLASLTKVVATTPLAMKMYQQQLLHLDKPVSAYVPEFSGGLKDSVTITNLLTHTSGLPAYMKFWEIVDKPSAVLDSIIYTPLVYTPGDSSKYSDLGIILLGHILEELGMKPLDSLAQQRVFNPLGMHHTEFLPPNDIWSSIAPTEFDHNYRHRQLQGEVHDENAAFLGGVAPHAGLFSTIGDLGRYAQMYLSNGYYNGVKFLKVPTIELFTRRQNIVKGSSRALGWDTASKNGSWSGDYMSPQAFLHTGYTGTSIVIDPKWNTIVILLTNRVYPTRENWKIKDFRPAFHNAVMKAILTPEELEQAKQLHQTIPD